VNPLPRLQLTDLDAESLALVNRAAPFPPPPGAQRSFAIEVAFGMGH
jgi:protein TonB